MYIQQGDVLLKRVPQAPIDLKPIETDLLYRGQNHHHRVRGSFQIAKKDEDTYLLSQGCELFHEEHHALAIPEGAYHLSIVLEYDHFLEESRQVID